MSLFFLKRHFLVPIISLKISVKCIMLDVGGLYEHSISKSINSGT